MRNVAKVVLVLVVALGMTTATIAPAAADRANTTISIKNAKNTPTGVSVDGSVSSPRDACEKNRRISVYHDVDPEGPSGNDFKLGSTTSDQNGKWQLDSPYKPDKVYAKAKKNRHCKKDVSKSEAVK